MGQKDRVEIRSARTGRPSSRPRVYQPDDLVRFDARIPARTAQRLYEVAHRTGRPVTAVHADVLAKALDDEAGVHMS